MKARFWLALALTICACQAAPGSEARLVAAGYSTSSTSHVFVDAVEFVTDANGQPTKQIIRDPYAGFVELQRYVEGEWHGYASEPMRGGSQQFIIRHEGSYRVVWFSGSTAWRHDATGAVRCEGEPFPSGEDRRVEFVLERTAETSIPTPTLTTWPTLTLYPTITPRPKATATYPVPPTIPIRETSTPALNSTPTAPPTLTAWQHISEAERLLKEDYPWLEGVHLTLEMDRTLFPPK